MMLARWVSAVFTLIPRKPATSLLLLPSARSCRISRSRGVKRLREDRPNDAGGVIEKIEVGRKGYDSNLGKIQYLLPIDRSGFFLGPRQQHHDGGRYPEDEKDVRRPGSQWCCVGKRLIISLQCLSATAQKEGPGEKRPELA